VRHGLSLQGFFASALVAADVKSLAIPNWRSDMKRLAMAAALVVALSIPTLAGEVPTMGVVTPQPPPPPSIATMVLLTIISLVGR
jgi:hypothetical protein